MSLDFIGSLFQASAQNQATKQNAQNVANTNRINLLLSLMSRGTPLSQAEANSLGVPELAGQSSAVLPTYLSKIETATGTNAGQMALALQAAAPTIGDYTQALAPYLQQMQNSQRISGDVLSGAMTQQMIQQEQPVAAARMNVATSQRDTALQQLDKTLNDIDAIQARKGYSGDSYGTRLAKFNASAGIMGTAAANVGAAKLQNALETQEIQNTGRQLQLSNLTTPLTLGGATTALKSAPTTTTANTFNSTMAPLSFFNIGNHPFQEQNLPTVDTTSQTGLALSGLTSNGNSALSTGLQKYFQNLNTPQGTSSGTVDPSQGQDWAALNGSIGAGTGADASSQAGTDVPAPAFGG